jgi:predicted dienelactone hydrolase
MGQFIALLTGLAIGAAASAAPSRAEVYTVPGPFAVGVQTFTVPDTSGKHPMATTIWYPAAGPAPDASKVLRQTMDAPAATTGPFPLVVVIHGRTGRGVLFGGVGRWFASHGLVAAAADFDTGPLDEGGSWVDRQSAWLLYNRPANVMQVIAYVDALCAPGGKLAGVVDTRRVGVWGLSTGGTTALEAAGAQVDLKAMDEWCAAQKADPKADETCQFTGHEQAIAAQFGVSDPFSAPMPPVWDQRVAALVAAAPGGELHAFGDKGLAAITIPALIMVAADDDVVAPEFNAFWAYDGIGSLDKTLVTFDHGGHTFFMNSSTPVFDVATALATAFFLSDLKGNPTERAAFSDIVGDHPGISIKTAPN